MKLVMILLLLSCFAAAVALAAVGTNDKDTEKTPQEPNILQKAAENPNFWTFISAIKAAGLEEELSKGGPYTLFAPTNAAFDKLPEGTMENLLKPENKEQLKNLLLNHIVKGTHTYVEIKKEAEPEPLTALSGIGLKTTCDKNGICVNEARIIVPDMKASNGLIQGVNQVLFPSKETEAPKKDSNEGNTETEDQLEWSLLVSRD